MPHSANTTINKFTIDGLLSLKNAVSKKDCNLLIKKIYLPKNLNDIFLKEIEYKKNPQVRKTNPGKGIENLAEEFNLNFIEKNTNLKLVLEKVLGKNYEVILKKFIIGVPKNRIPSWILKITSKELVGNLNKFIRPKFRKSTYFYGIDYHMDYIDIPNSKGNFITLYVYLNKVSKKSSPLNVVLKSHLFGATKFPHFIKKKTSNKIVYGLNSKKKSTFKIKTLTGNAGDINLWSCYTLHGTKPMVANTPRISLRYLIKSKNSNNHCLIKKLRDNIKYSKKLKITRSDIKKKKIRTKRIEYAIRSKQRILQNNT